MSSNQFLRKAISMRKRLLMEKKSAAPEGAVRSALNYLERWMNHWNPSEEQCKRFIQMHQDKVRMILPGTGSGCSAKMNDELNTLLR